MTKFYGVAKRPSIGRGKLYRLRDGYYTYMKTDPGIETTTSLTNARLAAKNLTQTTGREHFASVVAKTGG